MPALRIWLTLLAGLWPTPQDGPHERAWPVAPPLAIERGEVGPLPPAISAEADGRQGWSVTFAFASRLEAQRVNLAGSFNSWNAESLPLSRGADGRWRIRLTLPSGVHAYKLVLDGTRWIADPDNEDVEPDGFQQHNSLLRLGALGRPEQLAAERGDGRIAAEALAHEPARSLYRQRAPSGQLLLRYRTLANDLASVSLVSPTAAELPMRRLTRAGAFDYWEAALARPSEPLTYGFLLHDGDLVATHPESYLLDPAEMHEFRTPEWSQHAIWYQIMIDRFRRGSSSPAPRAGGKPLRPWTSSWYAPSEWEGQDGQSFYEFYVFERLYGGNLAGVLEGLDYLQELGVNALYFNPIFQAPGHHKYNATDFRHIDSGYGAGEDYREATRNEDLLDPSTWVWTPSDRVFLDFLKECKRRGLRVVLDGVFNHVGQSHPAYQDVERNGKASRFADWFEIRSWEPFEAVGWAGFSELPVFAKSEQGFACEAVKQHIFAITRRWMDPDGDGDPADGIDGWRLDVPMEIAMPFWEEWRALVKSINPEAYISGEVWEMAEEWLGGERFDAVMNYRFAAATAAWIGQVDQKLSASEFDARLSELRLAYPAEATSSLMDLLDSHDTDRFVSMMLNPDRAYDKGNREQEPGSTYDARRPDALHYQKLRLAVLLQMTYVGAPMIYYGDEVGMWGSDDPNNRKPMLWKELEPYAEPEQNFADQELLAYYRAAIALRNRYEALRVGGLVTVFSDDEQDLLVFTRELGEQVLLVALTVGEQDARFELPPAPGGQGWELVFGPPLGEREPDELEVSVPGCGGRVWRAR